MGCLKGSLKGSSGGLEFRDERIIELRTCAYKYCNSKHLSTLAGDGSTAQLFAGNAASSSGGCLQHADQHGTASPLKQRQRAPAVLAVHAMLSV